MAVTTETQTTSVFQEVMGNKITKLVLWGTIFIAIIGVTFAIIALFVDKDRVKEAFSIVQYVIGVLLPLWGTWIGTVLAYYYSKENFESANKSVQQIVDKITTDKKLQTIKAKDVMIPLDKLIFQEMKSDETLAKFKLKDDCLDFVKSNGIKRVIIMDENRCAKYVIHRDLISFFLADYSLQGNPVADLTLQDMYDNANADVKTTMDNCILFVNENATLFEAKELMNKTRTCQDVFVTTSGVATEPVLGWITNVTVNENAIV